MCMWSNQYIARRRACLGGNGVLIVFAVKHGKRLVFVLCDYNTIVALLVFSAGGDWVQMLWRHANIYSGTT